MDDRMMFEAVVLLVIVVGLGLLTWVQRRALDAQLAQFDGLRELIQAEVNQTVEAVYKKHKPHFDDISLRLDQRSAAGTVARGPQSSVRTSTAPASMAPPLPSEPQRPRSGATMRLSPDAVPSTRTLPFEPEPRSSAIPLPPAMVERPAWIETAEKESRR